MIPVDSVYRTLVVSSSEKFNENLRPLLQSGRCEPLTFTDSVASAKRILLEGQYDFVIVNSPLPDDTGLKFAIDVSSDRSTVCLVFIRAEQFEESRGRLVAHGVFALSKPTSSVAIAHGLDFMASMRERLKNMEKKTLSIEEKMEEIRLVNRAKWLLIDNLKMAEPDAHRYIEKQAMDLCIPRREVAREIINTYSI